MNNHPYERVSGGVTAPAGFRASGIHCGVKKSRKDLAIIASDVPAVTAAVFTQNKVPAAPVIVDKLQVKASSVAQAIVVNSGNANACTGERGLNDAWTMVAETANALSIDASLVLVSSTGVIGQYLPMEPIQTGIRIAANALHHAGGRDAAEAIMTTDTFVKELAVKTHIGGTQVVLGGMAKGSGMIAPNMATMLGFVTTDAAVEPALLKQMLTLASDRSFNRISVDGDTSTNDMVVLMANGAAGSPTLTHAVHEDAQRFYNALEWLLTELAKMIVLDGEGATKLVAIQVNGAEAEEEAVKAGRAVANSSLVKTALHGEDANWGRILAAIGYSGIDFDPEAVEIFFDEVPILQKKYSIDFSEVEAKRVLSKKELTITIELHKGKASACFWTCDLSKEYVDINAHYRT
ncbi:MAG TPA: bifunctional glutamate N-acetyltransferase/amino-acid acetyltransferase ArgJ [Bacteroidota bacterium]